MTGRAALGAHVSGRLATPCPALGRDSRGTVPCWRRLPRLSGGAASDKPSTRVGVLKPSASYRPARNDEGIVRLDVARADGEKKVSVVVPLNYAAMLGLRGRDLYLDPIVNTAYDDLFHQGLNPGYSAIAKLGKEKLLFAAREALRSVRGRVSLVHPDVTVEPVLLPGTMALLNQLGHYEVVIQMAEQVKNISTRDLKSTTKGTLRDYKKDVALASALANCGLAKSALEGGSVSLGYARLEEAFGIMEKNGGRGLSSELYGDIAQALDDLKSDAVIDTLKESLDLVSVTNRKGAVEAFVAMIKGSQPGITPEFVSKVLGYMTSIELVESMDWVRMVGSEAGKAPWLTAEVAMYVGVAHLVAGFAYRRPYLVAKARKVLIAAHRMQADVAIPMAVSEILLGETNAAIGILLEDERMAMKLRGAAHMSVQSAKAYPAERLPDRDEVMAYVRYNSPGPTNDLLPGVCTFVQLWLSTVAFPRVRDTRERPVTPSLADYFDAPGTARFLMSKSRGFGDILGPIVSFFRRQADMVGVVGARAATTTARAASVAGEAPFQAASTLAKRITATVNDQSVRRSASTAMRAATALLGLYVASQVYGAASKRIPKPALPSTMPALLSAPKSAKKRSSASKRPARAVVSTPVPLSKEEAKDLIETWLDIKAHAMGPRHVTQDLSLVLDEPMLSAVTSEAREAAKSGWFWNIRPLKVRIDAIKAQSDGSMQVTATVDEKADLYATSGKHGDHYTSQYRVEYTIVERKGGFKIATALVVGNP